VHLACAAALLLQLGSVLWNGYIRPSVTNTVVEETDLKDMDFPVVFKICVSPGFNETALHEAGYGYVNYGIVNSYFLGESAMNASILGWAGHTNTSGVQGSVKEVLSRVRSHTAGEVIDSIVLYTRDVKYIHINKTDVHSRLNYPDNCYLLDISSHAKGSDVMGLGIMFNYQENRSVELIAEGKTLTCDRIIMGHKFHSTGPNVRLGKMGTYGQYIMKIKQNVYMEKDATKNCRNYPNQGSNETKQNVGMYDQ
jgi:hypothetical protein